MTGKGGRSGSRGTKGKKKASTKSKASSSKSANVPARSASDWPMVMTRLPFAEPNVPPRRRLLQR